MKKIKHCAMSDTRFFVTVGGIVLCLAFMFIHHSNLTKMKLEAEQRHREQYIIYDMRSEGSRIVGEVQGKYMLDDMHHLIVVNNLSYLVTEEQYKSVEIGDTVFSEVKENN